MFIKGDLLSRLTQILRLNVNAYIQKYISKVFIQRHNVNVYKKRNAYNMNARYVFNVYIRGDVVYLSYGIWYIYVDPPKMDLIFKDSKYRTAVCRDDKVTIMDLAKDTDSDLLISRRDKLS